MSSETTSPSIPQALSRWSAPGPWEVRRLCRWYPLGTRLRWCRLTLRRSQRVASAEAAVAAARRALAGIAGGPSAAGLSGDAGMPSTAGVPSAAGLSGDAGATVETVVELRDRAGRLAWRGSTEADARAAARSAAGWEGEPPPAPGATLEARLPAPPEPASDTGGLTPAQRRVVEHGSGPAVVVAVAGAGKTTTMVARVRALVERGVAPERILLTSFSRAAVADVRDKLLATGVPELARVEVRTFHSLAHALLREAEAHLRPSAGAAAPAPERVAARLLEAAMDTWRRDGHPLAPALDDLDNEAFLAYRSRSLARLALPDPDERGLSPTARRQVRRLLPDPASEVHAPLLEAHERLRRERGWRDYDDLVVDAWAALAADERLRRRFAGRWTHRIVDEFQDVNPAQVALLMALLDDGREVMLIGDDDQSIYGFRGSDPALLEATAQRLGAARYVLDHNFRARPEPLAAAAALIERLPERVAKRLRAARPAGGVLTLDVVPGDAAEAAVAAERLSDAHADGVSWSRMALLLRTFAQAPKLEEALLERGIPYRLIGSPDLAARPVCRAALAGLHLVTVPSAPRAVRAHAWRHWLTGLGIPAAQAARRAASLAALSNGGWRALSCEPGRPRDRHDDPAIPSGAHPRSHGPADVRAATLRLALAAERGVVSALVAAASELLPWPRHGPAAAGLTALTRAVEAGAFGVVDEGAAAFLADFSSRRRRRAARSDRVCVTSAHRSKGLEWDVVVVPGQTLGVFPASDDFEERRLAYVAWTRARERLHLIGDAERPPSPFLADAEVEALVVLQRDLRWYRSGLGSASLAAMWALQEARHRFGEGRGTSAPRRTP